MTTEEAVAHLRSVCTREYTRASADPSPDRKVGRKAILEAEARLNAIPVSLSYAEFLDAAALALDELHRRYSRDDDLDPDGWGAGAIGAIENEIAELRRGA